MSERKTIEELMTMTRKEQNAYLATLPEKEADQLATEIFRAEADRNVQKLVDNLNSHAND
jgi:hypothetical protein